MEEQVKLPTIQALRPEFNSDFASLNATAVEKPVESAPADPADISVNTVSLSGGWRDIDEFMQDRLNEIKTTVTQAIASGATFEEIGQKAAFANAVEGFIESVRAKIKNAQEAVDAARGY